MIPLIAAGRGPAVLIGAVLFIPMLVGVSTMIARQLGHHRRALTSLRRARDEISRTERWRAALTSTLAHDVRSPLTAVQFALETLHDDIEDLPPAQRRGIIEAALRQTGRIRHLAADLLDTERIDTEGGCAWTSGASPARRDRRGPDLPERPGVRRDGHRREGAGRPRAAAADPDQPGHQRRPAR
nr:hypothetical protein GCM10020093_109930 [Planobispora longispora]